MPSKTTPVIETTPTPTPAPAFEDTKSTRTLETIDSKLQALLEHIERMDKRDRLRTMGSFFRSMIMMIPILAFLGSAWYFYYHGTEVLQQITDMSVKSAASYQQEGLMDQLEQYIGKPKQ